MNKYYCDPCGYIYNPEDNNGIPFEELDDDYMCPVCGIGKNGFSIIHKKGDNEYQGEAQEKHIPIIEVNENDVVVKVGSIEHPMTEDHYIKFIGLYDDGELIETKQISKDDKPKISFTKPGYTADLSAVAKCNVHGLWQS